MNPEQLKEARMFMGYTQTECAQKAGVHLDTYGRWERGVIPMPKPERFWFLNLPSILRK